MKRSTALVPCWSIWNPAQWTPFVPVNMDNCFVRTTLYMDKVVLVSWNSGFPWFDDLQTLSFNLFLLSFDHQATIGPKVTTQKVPNWSIRFVR